MIIIHPVKQLVRSIASKKSAESFIDDSELFSSDTASFSQWTNSQVFSEDPHYAAPSYNTPPSAFTFTLTNPGLRTKRNSFPHLKRRSQSNWTIDTSSSRRSASEDDPYYHPHTQRGSTSHEFGLVRERKTLQVYSPLGERDLNIRQIEVECTPNLLLSTNTSIPQCDNAPTSKKARFTVRGLTVVYSGARTVKSLLPGGRKPAQPRPTPLPMRPANHQRWTPTLPKTLRQHLRPTNPFRRRPKVRPSPFANMPYDIPFFDPAPTRPRSFSV